MSAQPPEVPQRVLTAEEIAYKATTHECGWAEHHINELVESKVAEALAHVASLPQREEAPKPLSHEERNIIAANTFTQEELDRTGPLGPLTFELRSDAEAQREEAPKPPEMGWLIESSDGQGPLWAGFTDHWAWVTDSLKAIRFARKQDAELFASAIGTFAKYDKITEHQWGL